MLIDAIADTALFSLDDAMMDTLQKFCRKHKVGIRKRLEAPHDISMEAQKVAWERLQLKERFHIDISEGFMYDPSKLRARYLFCQMTKRSSGKARLQILQ